MNNEKLTYGIIGLIIGVILTLLIAPRWNYNGWGGMMGGYSMMYGGRQMMGDIDARFIEQMIPHHDDAITMAEIALQKADHPEIKQLAQNIIFTQTAENNKMREWYKDWFGKEVPDTFGSVGGMGGMSSMMMSGMMGDATNIESLETAEPFDKEFIRQMIFHHQMAVMMAQMIVNTSSRTEMREMAQDIIDAQSSEITQMREWYRSWYNS